MIKNEISKELRFKQLQEIAQYQLKIMTNTNLTKSIKRLTKETYIDEQKRIENK